MAQERERWDNRLKFVMAAVGSAVGLGNVWRFPYICYQNGGGAFLIPYFVALFTAGIPLMILELGLGHKMSLGAPESLRKLNRGSEWLGWSMIIFSFVIILYYAVIMSWVINYIYHSFHLSWADNAENFFFKDFLKLSAGPLKFGSFNWPVFIGLALAWLFIYLSIFGGIKWVGKVVMWTVPLPTALLIIFFFRGITLPGALEGLKFYLTPNFAILKDPKVWLSAYGQIFFSLSLAFGVMIAYASYLPKRADITNNAFIISFANCGTSFFAGFAVFSVVGFLARQLHQPVNEVVAKGLPLAFITYPTIIRLLPFGAVFFGVIFFVMLVTLAVDSAFSIVEGVVTAVKDQWKIKKKTLITIFCLLGFGGGTIFCFGGGLFWIDIVDNFVNAFGIVLMGLLQCIVVGWLFGAKKMRDYINDYSEIRLGYWWDICITIITPAILTFTLLMNIIENFKKPYEGYPLIILYLLGWSAVILPLLFGIIIPFFRKKKRVRIGEK
ncbi:hypothetical protein ES702_02073 [subsurface metagenome]